MDISPPAPGSIGEIIGQIPLFAGLGHAETAQLCATSKRFTAKIGDLVIEEGAQGDALFVILAGELEITKRDVRGEIVLARRGTGEVLGEMSLLEQMPRTASARALVDSDILEIDSSAFRKVLEGNPAIATSILRTVASRLRSTESSLMQREKLASLGTLAAGLAHELNNPAAAIQRSSTYLREVLAKRGRHGAELRMFDLSQTERQRLGNLELLLADDTSLLIAAANPDDEEQMISRLETLGVAEPWEIGPPIAVAGWKLESIEELVAAFAPSHRDAAMGWLSARLSALQLVGEIQRSGRAISDIVRAVKSYAYLDQGAVQEVDLATSLEDTLMILKHKLKQGIEVMRDYQKDLPRIEAFAGELNQVWTNLIDNAIDAMGGKGVLEVHARKLGDNIEVSIADSGPGIPPDIAARIFDPFFTTKPQGHGTGLGLHIAHNIVVNRHRGSVNFTSAPGRTEFRVNLPLRLAARG